MATAAMVTVEEYLATTYRPDCDYVNGELLERNMGELNHAELQGLILEWLRSRRTTLRIRPYVELRLRVGSQRYRIPDVVVLSADAPREQVVETPPLLCIEILSPGDTLARTWDRTQDYLSIGVPVCWIIDATDRRAWTVTSAGLVEAKDGVLRAGAIEFPLADLSE